MQSTAPSDQKSIAGDSRIVLVRHGETEWSREGLHTSISDIELTSDGEAQARCVGEELAGRTFAEVLVSPMQRAVRTAQLADIVEYQTEPNLVEWNYGVYEGRTTPAIAAELGHDWTIWKAGTAGEPALGETLENVGQRTDAVLARLAPTLEQGGDVLLIAHAHVLRILAARWLGLPPSAGALFALGTGSVSELAFEHGTPVIETWNRRP